MAIYIKTSNIYLCFNDIIVPQKIYVLCSCA